MDDDKPKLSLMHQITLALDWTPNINHIGFFVALKQGYYRELGLDVTIVSPSLDDYEKTPAKRVELGEADFALCPTESIISYRTKSKPFPLVAIAAVLQSDLSAIVTQKGIGLDRPKDLDAKLYSSYKARYEDGIVQEMIKNDGGRGDLKVVYPRKLGIWETVLKGQADATWIFENWEGIEAQVAEVELNYFRLKDYGIPYSYSPVIAANENLIADKLESYQAFLAGSKKGYITCQEQPLLAAALLSEEIAEADRAIDLDACLAFSAEHFGNAENWGQIDIAELDRFLNWLREKGLEHSQLKVKEIFNSSCLS